MRSLILVSAILALAACGGGSDGGGPTDGSTLSGWYRYEREIGPGFSEIFTAEIRESGDALLLCGMEHVRDGDEWVHFDPAWYSPSRLVRRLRMVDEDRLDGVFENYGRDLLERAEPLTLVRASRPTGSLSYTGVARGVPIDGEGEPAHARALHSAGTYSVMVYSVPAEVQFLVSLSFQQDPPIAPGTYDLVNTSLGNVYVQVGNQHTVCTAVTLILTDWSATHTTGSFIVLLTTGERLDGHFDVPIHPD